MIRALFLAFASLLLAPWAPAQDAADYGRAVVDTLASPAFAGRGYLDDADGRAAAYIAGEFERLGLAPVLDTYLQPFPLAVDVYPETPTLVAQPTRVNTPAPLPTAVPVEEATTNSGNNNWLLCGFGGLLVVGASIFMVRRR